VLLLTTGRAHMPSTGLIWRHIVLLTSFILSIVCYFDSAIPHYDVRFTVSQFRQHFRPADSLGSGRDITHLFNVDNCVLNENICRTKSDVRYYKCPASNYCLKIVSDLQQDQSRNDRSGSETPTLPSVMRLKILEQFFLVFLRPFQRFINAIPDGWPRPGAVAFSMGRPNKMRI